MVNDGITKIFDFEVYFPVFKLIIVFYIGS